MSKDELSFGKRYGFEPVQLTMQTNSMDRNLRTDFWNAFYIFIYGPLHQAESYANEPYRGIYKSMWAHYFTRPVDEFPSQDHKLNDVVKYHIENNHWWQIYDLFEIILKYVYDNKNYKYEELINFLQQKLTKNISAYTIVNNQFLPITNEAEVAEIKRTDEEAREVGLAGVHTHLKTAIDLLSKKPTPDYRNSIKESISMVEAICRIIEPESTLGKALNKLDKGQKLNTNLKNGFEQLYAFTNGKDGVRHAMMDEQGLELEDARYFLVSCSAFTNYMIEKAKKGGLLK